MSLPFPTRSKGRGRGRRHSNETVTDPGESDKPGRNSLAVKRSISMPVGCTSLQSVAEFQDTNSDHSVSSVISAGYKNSSFLQNRSKDSETNHNNCNLHVKKMTDNHLENNSFDEQQFAWDCLEELSESVKSMSISDKSNKQKTQVNGALSETWGNEKALSSKSKSKTYERHSQSLKEDLLEKLPEPLSVEDSLLHADYPIDIDAIEAELNFMRDAEDGEEMASSYESTTFDSVPMSRKRSFGKGCRAGTASVMHVRQPLSQASSQEDIWSVEAGMPSGMYTAKGRRGMFKCFKICQEDTGNSVILIHI